MLLLTTDRLHSGRKHGHQRPDGLPCGELRHYRVHVIRHYHGGYPVRSNFWMRPENNQACCKFQELL